jgi:hypothetical protein
MLKDLNDIKVVYDTSKDNIAEELINPLLSNSKHYDRGVAYFTSSWLRNVLNGIESFVQNKGRMRLLTSPEISEEDFETIKTAQAAIKDKVLFDILEKQIERNFANKTDKDILNLLWWLVADGYIDVKFVLPENKTALFHDKFGIFNDDNDSIVIHGSLNDSNNAFNNNLEGISVYKSWVDGQREYVKAHKNRFESLWKNENAQFKTFNSNEFINRNLKKYKRSERPYKTKKEFTSNQNTPMLPLDFNLRDYQKEALCELKKNNWSGIYEMATGTGKTKTSIAASVEYYNMTQRIALIIIVPQKHLVNQWVEELHFFGYSNVLECYGENQQWREKLSDPLQFFRTVS